MILIRRVQLGGKMRSQSTLQRRDYSVQFDNGPANSYFDNKALSSCIRWVQVEHGVEVNQEVWRLGAATCNGIDSSIGLSTTCTRHEIQILESLSYVDEGFIKILAMNCYPNRLINILLYMSYIYRYRIRSLSFVVPVVIGVGIAP